MNIKEIKDLVELLEGTDINEIKISKGDESIKITRPIANSNDLAAIAPMQFAPQQIVNQPPQTSAQQTATNSVNTNSEQTSIPAKLILSPMVGTFYSTPNPDSDAFVKVGQSVKIGDPVCIVEAMKMFNKIEADAEGIIKSILVKDGDPVEFDQPLFEIE